MECCPCRTSSLRGCSCCLLAGIESCGLPRLSHLRTASGFSFDSQDRCFRSSYSILSLDPPSSWNHRLSSGFCFANQMHQRLLQFLVPLGSFGPLILQEFSGLMLPGLCLLRRVQILWQGMVFSWRLGSNLDFLSHHVRWAAPAPRSFDSIGWSRAYHCLTQACLMLWNSLSIFGWLSFLDFQLYYLFAPSSQPCELDYVNCLKHFIQHLYLWNYRCSIDNSSSLNSGVVHLEFLYTEFCV